MKSFIRRQKVKISFILLTIFLAIIMILFIYLFKFRTLGKILEINDEIYFMQVFILTPQPDIEEVSIETLVPPSPYEYPFVRDSYDEKFVLSEEIGESLLNTLLNTKVRRNFFHKTNNSLDTDRFLILIWRDVDSFYGQDNNFDYIDIYIESSQNIRIFPYKRKKWDCYYNLKVHEDDADIIQVISELFN